MTPKQPIAAEPPPRARAAFDVVAVAASAGGLTALSEVLSGLPPDFPAAIVVVQHLDPRHRSLMADILSRRTALRAEFACGAPAAPPGKRHTRWPCSLRRRWEPVHFWSA